MKKMYLALIMVVIMLTISIFAGCARSCRSCRNGVCRPRKKSYRTYGKSKPPSKSSRPRSSRQNPQQPSQNSQPPQSYQQFTQSQSGSQGGEAFRPVLKDYECSFAAYAFVWTNIIQQTGSMKNLAFLESPKTLVDAMEGAVISSGGQGYNASDKQRFFQFLKKANNDAVVEVAQQNMSKLLVWLYTETDCEFNTTEFCNMVNALENLSATEIDATIPPDYRMDPRKSGPVQTSLLRLNTLAAYIYLNMRFGPQAIQQLRDEFNIVSYGKFGPRELANTLGPKKTNLPLLVVLSSSGDRGGSQYSVEKMTLTGSLTLTHDVRLFDINRPEDILKGIEFIGTTFGKINCLVFVSHSNADVLEIRDGNVFVTGAEPFLQEATQYFAADAEGVLSACGSGAKNDGVARNISNSLGIPIYAPAREGETRVPLIEFKNGKISYVCEQGSGDIGVPIRKFTPTTMRQIRTTDTETQDEVEPRDTKPMSLRELLEKEG